MVVLNRIYTRTGDKGETGLGSGKRVPKYDLRIEAYGTVDETNACVGVARLGALPDLDAMLARIQNDLFDLGADLCVPADDSELSKKALRINASQVSRLVTEIDLVNLYDDYPVIVMIQYEDLGFCAKGEGPAFVQSRTLTRDGTFPTNTSGGQLSVGQAGAAGGYIGLVETVRQLTGEAAGREVPDAKLGLVSGFGMVTYDRCLCTGALILARGESR